MYRVLNIWSRDKKDLKVKHLANASFLSHSLIYLYIINSITF